MSMESFTHPVLSCEESAEFENRLLGGEAAKERAAMEKAGRMIGAAMLQDFREITPIPPNLRLLILAGKGHNAGDAFYAADEGLKKLPEASVDIISLNSERELKPLAKEALDTLRETAGVRANLHPWSESAADKLAAQPFDILIDGAMGMRFKPPLKDKARAAIDWANKQSPGMRVAVDLPSGVGDMPDRSPFRADFTYAPGIAKLPLFKPENALAVGRPRYIDIGFFDQGERPKSAERSKVALARALTPLRALRPAAQDKRDHGHLFILGGSRLMPGALQMAAMAAVSSGVGRVTVFTTARASRMAAAVPEAMWQYWRESSSGGWSAEGLETLRSFLPKATALAIGPGMGTDKETRSMLVKLVKEARMPVALDADALSADVAHAALNRPHDFGGAIFTPHAGEFVRMARLSPGDSTDEDLRIFSKRHNAITLLKGPVTRICDGKRLVRCAFGGPVLGRGGSGDILTGLIGGLIARPGADAFASACRAAVWHGVAADMLARERGQSAVRTTELIDWLSPALRDRTLF